MRKPSLQSYGLSENDFASLQRRAEVLPSRLTSACAAIGALCGFLVGLSTGERGAAFSYGWIGFIGGSVVAIWGGDALLRLVWKRNARVQRYVRFKSDLEAFEAAVKEAEARELRTRAAFWQSLPGHRFEHELAPLFKRQGYDVDVTRGSGDGGVDIFLRRSGRTTVVQCKQTTHPVGPAAARELYACLMHFSADDGILATVGGVTAGVHKYFNGKPLRVMDLSEILRLHKDYQEQDPHAPRPVAPGCS